MIHNLIEKLKIYCHTDPTDLTDFKFAPSSQKFFKINDVPKAEAYRLSQG